MLDFSDTALSVLSSSNFQYYIRAESWRSDDLLMVDIPVTKAIETVDLTLNVPERISLTFPRIVDGVDLSPYDEDSPLAANGQQLRLEVGIGIGHSQIEWVQKGWYLIYTSGVQDDTIEVDAWGLLTWIQEARFVTPFQPSGTIKDTIRKLVEPALTVVFDVALSDRSVPSNINYSDDRLDTLNSVLDAWPAVARINTSGDLEVSPATTSTTPVKTLSDRAGGTIIKATGTSTREGAFNAVVARGVASDGTTVQGEVAYDSESPKRFNGPFSPLLVPLFFESPLLTTVAQATAAANTRMANIMRQSAKSYEVTMVPDISLEAGDTVFLDSVAVGSVLGIIETLTGSLVAGNGTPMTLVVKEL